MRVGITLRVLAGLAALGCFDPPVATAITYVHLYGGPGSLDGRFEDAQGDIDLQGWLGVACPEVGIEYMWQVNDFQAENLNSHGPGNHAMWAGQTVEQRPTWATAPGYGDAWNTAVQWSHTAPTMVAPFEVQLDAVYNHDTEETYDFVHVEWNQAGSWQSLEQIDGTSAESSGEFLAPGVALFHEWIVHPADLVGGELRIRLRVTSDPIVSDQSGNIGAAWGDSDGAIQIDDITVSFDGAPADGGGDADGVATFENGDDEGWTPQPDTCSCSAVSELAGDVDPGPDNLTPQIGYFRSSAYPGHQPGICVFESPVITWDLPEAQGLDSALLRFRNYRESNGSTDGWDVIVRSRVNGEWRAYRQVVELRAPAPGWETYELDITEEVWLDAEAIQLRFRPYAGDASELQLTFDDVEVMRFDVPTAVSPTTSTSLVELEVYPNPTNPSSSIRYTVDIGGPVRIELFDARGRRVRTIFEDSRPAGTHEAHFDGLDDDGGSLASGVYFVRLEVNGRTYGERVVVVR